jgi:phosphatidylserine/phosphatidylglycerophosphate/cardiolipin synthase-like enzyme
MQSAHNIALTAYTMPQGAVLDGLVSAAERGARVRVRLEGWIYKDAKPDGSPGPIAQANLATVKALTDAGADAKLEHPDKNDGQRVLHMKSAVVDDAVFLDDRNWPNDGQDTILRDDFTDDIATVKGAEALPGSPASKFLNVHKRDSLFTEAKLLWEGRKGDDIIVETESFGSGDSAYTALGCAAQRGAHIRVLVSARDLQNNASELRAIAALAGPNIEFRACDGDEKFAVLDGKHGWVGSSNLSGTYSKPDQIDWGLRTNNPEVLAHVSAAFDQRWNNARALAFVSDATSSGEMPSTSATLSRVSET